MLEVERTDVIIVSSVVQIEQTLDRQDEAVTWLKAHYDKGVLLAAINSGAFLLAETGLLDGKEATTNRETGGLFRQRYPNVLLKLNRLITDQNRLLCVGSSNASFDLVAHLAQKIYGVNIAIELRKKHGYDTEVALQAPCEQVIHQCVPADKPIRGSLEWMENNYSKPINIGRLAKMSGMSRRTFERRFKNITRGTPLQYLQRIRVEKAKWMLKAGEMTFQDITYQVGYEDSCYFRKLFQKITGLSPSVYNKEKFDNVCQVDSNGTILPATGKSNCA